MILSKEKGHVETGDYIINLAMPITEKGMVNTMRVSEMNKFCIK
jgi:hypothetical protein